MAGKEKEKKEEIYIEGIIENIIYNSSETYFTVAKIKCKDNSKIIIVGKIDSPNKGERIKVKGKWYRHPKYGLQLNIDAYEKLLPNEKNEIEKYLSSYIKGIGPKLASKIVKVFGDETFKVLDNNPDKILNISGIGNKNYEMIIESWKKQQESREIMVCLSKYGIQGKLAQKIYEKYGKDASLIIKEHPYRLAIEIEGIGFKTADKIAREVGIPEEDPERIKAGVLHVLRENANGNGHCFLPKDLLLEEVEKLLNLDKNKIYDEVCNLAHENFIVIDKLSEKEQEEVIIYLRHLHFYEKMVSIHLKRIKNYPKIYSVGEKLEKLIDYIHKLEEEYNIKFTSEQIQAIITALKEKICIITGGPGVGKTTIIKTLVRILKGGKIDVGLAAPTGRASKRLSQASLYPASTIHRLLKYNPSIGTFEYNRDNQLSLDHIIIDETSMIDIPLAYYLLQAIKNEASITFVGDFNQLPSVGPGNFLADIINSNIFPIIKLKKIFRQAQGSSIVETAHQINAGIIPTIHNHPSSDIFFFEVESPQKGAEIIVDLVSNILPKKYNLNPKEDIQVITPMYRGEVGADNLNEKLSNILNPNGREIANKKFKEGDKVMQIVNNYEKDVFNGDIGIIKAENRIENVVVVDFEGRSILYEYNELEELVKAYAISIHKSQGSEYPIVIIPLFTEHYIMLERNLIYTAITRGKNLVILIGSKKALYIAVSKVRAKNRFTNLKNLLIM